MDDELSPRVFNARDRWSLLRCCLHLVHFFVACRRREWNLKKELAVVPHELRIGIRCKVGDEVVARISDDYRGRQMLSNAPRKCDEAKQRERPHRLTRKR